MGGVSPVLWVSEGPHRSCEVGQQHQWGIQEAATAERGKEQLAPVVLCLLFHVSAKETHNVDA